VFIDVGNRTNIFISTLFYLFTLSFLKTNPYTPIFTSIFLLLIYFKEKKILYVLPLLFPLFLPLRINTVFPLKNLTHMNNNVSVQETSRTSGLVHGHVSFSEKTRVTDVANNEIHEIWKREISINIILYSIFFALFFLLMTLVKMRKRLSKTFLTTLFFILGVFFTSFFLIQLMGFFVKDLKYPLSTSLYGKTSEDLEYSLKAYKEPATSTFEEISSLDLTPVLDIFTWIVTGLSVVGAYLSITLFLKTCKEGRNQKEEHENESQISKKDNFARIFSIKDENFIVKAYLWLRKTFFPTCDNLTPLEILNIFSGENFTELTEEFIRVKYALKKSKGTKELKEIFCRAVEELKMWRKAQSNG